MKSYHITMREQLVERFPGLLYFHRDGDLVLLFLFAVIFSHPLNHLHLFFSITTLTVQ